jgi:hypothetical protein
MVLVMVLVLVLVVRVVQRRDAYRPTSVSAASTIEPVSMWWIR